MGQSYKYFAFISYNTKDAKWARKIQRKLEHYRMPTTLCNQKGWAKNPPIQPVFFAETDIQPGPLDKELKQRLEQSRYLIIICSPNSAKSNWVGKEIQYFIDLQRESNIHLFIIEGIPYSGDINTECIHPSIKKSDIPEILGVNVNEQIYKWHFLNKERAYVQLITKLLGVEFDSIWNRHKRILIRNILSIILLLTSILLLFYLFAIPIKLNIKLVDENHHLPTYNNAEVIVNQSHYPIPLLDTCLVIDIPGYYKMKPYNITFQSKYYETQSLNYAYQWRSYHNITINLLRDNTFAIYAGVVINENREPLPKVCVTIANKYQVYTNKQGEYKIILPIEQQDVVQRINIFKEGYIPITKEEIPSDNAIFVLFENKHAYE